MTDPAIIEAAERALQDWFNDTERCHGAAKDVVAAVTPLIRAEALEEAAEVAEGYTCPATFVPKQIAADLRALKPAIAAIRALKEQP